MEERYSPKIIEEKWQKIWEEEKVFVVPKSPKGERLYILDMFPYPSASGLHVGHPEGYTASDVLSRYHRMRGKTVLHPMGWDAFGLPAENFAIKTKTHPRDVTEKNINHMRGQIQRLGFSYDWSREVATTDERYYKWTQWIFLKLHEHGLAYEAEVPVWWCEALGTVLANEEVIDGKSEIGGYPCVRRPFRQWMLKITAYADRLLEGLERVDWPENIKTLQRNWIGRSEGAEVQFTMQNGGWTITVFTTRPDTLFGVTYMVLAPEHELVKKITTPKQQSAVAAYREKAAMKSDLERTDLAKKKTGVFTGSYAVHPLSGAKLPVWISDYVLASYGTGAVMAVPAHDQRDFDFAKQFNLPVQQVISPDGMPHELGEAYTEEGLLLNSGEFSGMPSEEARKKVTEALEEKGIGRAAVTYKLRDWLFSRQRYWGEPIPVLHKENGEVVRVPESELPVTLPDVAQYAPTGTGESPLAAMADWVQTTDPHTGEPAKRETNTMPQWAGSNWYFLRFLDPANDEQLADPELIKQWMPVDLYIGGAEHAVLHLLYARFIYKFLFDIGVVPKECGDEPFVKLRNQGMILGEDNQKMSKSRGNVIDPDDIVDAYGADTMRLYEMFMGPFEDAKPWSTKGISGVHRFLHKVWQLQGTVRKDAAISKGTEQLLHQTVKKVGEDIEHFRFNTAIAQLMILANQFSADGAIAAQAWKAFVRLLAPFAPHIAHELNERAGKREVLMKDWPTFDAAKATPTEVTVIVQVNGRLRAKFAIPKGTPQRDVDARARAAENVAKYLAGKNVMNVVFVPDRLINYVVR